MRQKSISELIVDYFRERPNQELQHGPVVDWVEERYLDQCGKKPRDPWRAIRKLYQEGVLQKVRKGVYKYDPDLESKKDLLDFLASVKQEIFRRDNYRCVACGRGRQDGIEIHADHLQPLDKGGTNTIDNGQTLCSEHNILKKNYSQTELGKRLLTRVYQEAFVKGDQRIIRFCSDVFDVYDKHRLDTHIERPDINKE